MSLFKDDIQQEAFCFARTLRGKLCWRRIRGCQISNLSTLSRLIITSDVSRLIIPIAHLKGVSCWLGKVFSLGSRMCLTFLWKLSNICPCLLCVCRSFVHVLICFYLYIPLCIPFLYLLCFACLLVIQLRMFASCLLGWFLDLICYFQTNKCICQNLYMHGHLTTIHNSLFLKILKFWSP